MTELVLRSARFRAEREADWTKLEALLKRAVARGPKALSDDELAAIPVLYRSALSSLSVARAISLDKALVAYLEDLCARAYFFVYGAHATVWERLAAFFRFGWPQAVSGLWRETIAAALVMLLAGAVGYGLVAADPDWYYSFVPEYLSGGRNPAASTEFLRDGLYEEYDLNDGLSTFAAQLFTHNSMVALFAFALGFAFGIPTVLLLAYNGVILGAFFALYAQRGLGWDLGGWLFIHGVTELFAIVLAGAAGLRIGMALAFPGQDDRLASAKAAGHQAATVVAGVVLMLFFAGLIEAFARQLITDITVRYTFAVVTGLIWIAYFYGPRGRREGPRG